MQGFGGAAGAAIAAGTPDTTGIAANAPANVPTIIQKPKHKPTRAERRYGGKSHG